MQAAEAEVKKYEAAQQTEQSAFVAGIADLDSAVTAMQSYSDMSSAKAVFEEVIVLPNCTMLLVSSRLATRSCMCRSSHMLKPWLDTSRL